MGKDFLTLTDFSAEEILDTLNLAREVKELTKAGNCPQPFRGKTFGMIFHKPSLRTRISFETGVYQLGGYSLFITDKEIELGKRESIADIGRVLSRFLHGIVIRTFSHQHVEELAEWSSVPVINALTDKYHPCQIMGDLQTILEHKGRIEGIKLTYFGDGNNVANSLINAAYRLPIDVTIACAEDTLPIWKFLTAQRMKESAASESFTIRLKAQRAPMFSTPMSGLPWGRKICWK